MIIYVDDALYYAINRILYQDLKNSSNLFLNLKILPYLLVPSKKDGLNRETEVKEVKIRFGNWNYRSIIGALLYVSCCARPDITYTVNKLAKFLNRHGIIHFRALLHLIGYIKGNSIMKN